jgi:hypothetical protein
LIAIEGSTLGHGVVCVSVRAVSAYRLISAVMYRI